MTVSSPHGGKIITEHFSSSGSIRGIAEISLDSPFAVEVNYNMTGMRWEYRVNGATIGSGALTGVIPTTFQWLVVGSHAFDDAAPTSLEIVHDNVGVSDQGWLGPSWSEPQGRFLPQY